MNSRQRKTLAAIYSKQTPKSLAWDDLVSLLLGLECDMERDGGSHFAFRRNNRKVDFRRPHPGNETKPYQVRDAKSFLISIGVTP